MFDNKRLGIAFGLLAKNTVYFMKKFILFALWLCGSLESAFSQETRNADKFAFSMLKKLSPDDEKNVFLSAYSIRTILSLCAEGAKNTTLQEMQKTLFLDADASQRQKEMQTTIQKISAAKDFKLITTNMLWIEKSLKLLDSYKKIAKDFYLAGAEIVDFKQNHEKARSTINQFVANKTNQMIKNLLPSGAVTRETKMILTNTIYFKADWAQGFDPKKTGKENFKVQGKTETKVDMMNQKANFKAGTWEGHKVVELPYKGNQVSMWVVLPKENSIKDFLSTLDAVKWNTLKASTKKQEVILSLPKFEFETKYMLADHLKGMGMPTAFGDAAEFSSISEKTSLKISEVIHQAKIKVEEKGTEAAAATAVIMVATSTAHQPEPKQPFVFKADRPFLFVIEHTETKEILFMGSIQNPLK